MIMYTFTPSDSGIQKFRHNTLTEMTNLSSARELYGDLVWLVGERIFHYCYNEYLTRDAWMISTLVQEVSRTGESVTLKLEQNKHTFANVGENIFISHGRMVCHTVKDGLFFIVPQRFGREAVNDFKALFKMIGVTKAVSLTERSLTNADSHILSLQR